jgi:hypothetical protein
MKNIFFFFVIAITLSCKAQSPIYTLGKSPVVKPDNCYLKDTNNVLNKFAGTWTFVQNNKTFTITLQKAEMVKLMSYYKDKLQGSLKYYGSDGLIMADTESFTGRASKLSGARMWSDPNKVTIYFTDPDRPKVHGDVILTYSNIGGVEKLDWKLYQTGVDYRLSNEPPVVQGFKVPTDCVLVKQ